MAFFNDIGSKVNRGFNQVTSRSKDYAGQMRMDSEIRALEKNLQLEYASLGQAVYNAGIDISGAGEGAKDAASRIGALQGQIQFKKGAQQTLKEKIVCPVCGRTLEAESKFCGFCGARLGGGIQVQTNTPPIERTCVRCGASLNEGDRFCMNCGAPAEALNTGATGEQPVNISVCETEAGLSAKDGLQGEVTEPEKSVADENVNSNAPAVEAKAVCENTSVPFTTGGEHQGVYHHGE